MTDAKTMADPESQPFPLRELLDSVVAHTAAKGKMRRIPVEIAISPAVPVQLMGDREQISQVLGHLLENALKFSAQGQICVTVWCKMAEARVLEVIFAVSDEGPGLSSAAQKKLFPRSRRGLASRLKRAPGSGLGLAQCKHLVEKMHGRIWLESELGRGSCFYFSVPLPSGDGAAKCEPAATPVLPEQRPVAIVVDVEEYNRRTLRQHLESLGYSVQTATDGETALALADSLEITLALLDYHLPGQGALHLVRSIRTLPNRSARCRVIVTTTFATPENRAECLASGVDAVLGQPVTTERLRKALGLSTLSQPAHPFRPHSGGDGLANLRLIAMKKGISLAEELALLCSEFDIEMEQLGAALKQEDVTRARRCAHLLYGHCAFIGENGLESLFRKTESLAANQQWDDARTLSREAATRLAQLRLTWISAAPTAPPG